MNHTVMVTGTDNAYFAIRGWTLAYGRGFSEGELRTGAPVCILATTTATALPGEGSPVGSQVRVGKISCDVIGLLARREASTFGQDDNDTVIIPLRALQRRILGKSDVQSISVTFRDGLSQFCFAFLGPCAGGRLTVKRLVGREHHATLALDPDLRHIGHGAIFSGAQNDRCHRSHICKIGATLLDLGSMSRQE